MPVSLFLFRRRPYHTANLVHCTDQTRPTHSHNIFCCCQDNLLTIILCDTWLADIPWLWPCWQSGLCITGIALEHIDCCPNCINCWCAPATSLLNLSTSLNCKFSSHSSMHENLDMGPWPWGCQIIWLMLVGIVDRGSCNYLSSKVDENTMCVFLRNSATMSSHNIHRPVWNVYCFVISCVYLRTSSDVEGPSLFLCGYFHYHAFLYFRSPPCCKM